MNEPEIIPVIPTGQEIDNTFDLIIQRLEEPRMSLKVNAQVKTGYEMALDILEGTKVMTDINDIGGVQASAIAMLAADYLIGECSQKVLLGVPLKGGLPLKMTIN